MTESVTEQRPGPPSLDPHEPRGCPLCDRMLLSHSDATTPSCLNCRATWDGLEGRWLDPGAPRCTVRHPDWELYRCLLHEHHLGDHAGRSDAAVPHMLVPAYVTWEARAVG